MKHATLFTDGASRGNPGHAGAGFVLTGPDGDVIFEGKDYLGELTNNQAEYIALQKGIEKAVECGIEKIDIKMDSELIVRQIKGEYRVKNEGLKPFYLKVLKLLDKFEKYSIGHVPREMNKIADNLANRAIDEAI